MIVTYQTEINEINQIPVISLPDVYNLIHSYHVRLNEKEKKRNNILQFAGAWTDLSENEFLEITREIKQNRNEMFNREIKL